MRRTVAYFQGSYIELSIYEINLSVCKTKRQKSRTLNVQRYLAKFGAGILLIIVCGLQQYKIMCL